MSAIAIYRQLWSQEGKAKRMIRSTYAVQYGVLASAKPATLFMISGESKNQ